MNDIYTLFNSHVCRYTRDQAIKQGVLIDVSVIAKKIGFNIPVAVTSAVWDQYISWSESDTEKQTNQDQSERLWDVLWMLYVNCIHSKSATTIYYRLKSIPRDGIAKSSLLVRLKSTIIDGIEGEPAITIMLSSED